MSFIEKPTMHCQAEIEADTTYDGLLPDETLWRWFHDRYSTSKHLLTLYSIAKGLPAQNILEIGFGRSSFVLAKAAGENKGRLVTCDMRDFSYLLNADELAVTTFVNGKSDKVWEAHIPTEGFDFAFLDYFSGEGIPADFVQQELKHCIGAMKQNGIIAIHDTIVGKYTIGSVLDRLKLNWIGIHRPEWEILSLPYNYGLGLIRIRKESPFGVLPDTFVKKPEQ